MALFSQLKGLFFRYMPKPGENSLGFLNSAQFLGVLNDNIFKLVLVYLLIDIEGRARASTILSAVGATFVVPFLLFSSTAGILADRFSKQRLLILMKVAEMTIMLLAIVAFGLKSIWAGYVLLFTLATHSALFGPSKYGIIPELVPPEKVGKANGLITSFTYLAIIIGTFLASFITDVSNRNFVLIGGFCFLVAVAGFISTFGIKRTLAQGSQKKLNIFFVKEIYHTLVFCRERKHLLPALFGSAYFLFMGAFAQLNIIPYAIESLHLSDIAGGYLFLATALGIAGGAFLTGKVTRKRVDLAIPCIAGLCVALFLFCLFLFPHHLLSVTIFLIFVGAAGGMFIVPFDSFVQLTAPNEKRGQVIGAANFLSFFGVLCASFALFLFSEVLGVSPATGFGIIGVLSFLVSIFLALRLSDAVLTFFSRKLLRPFLKPLPINLETLEKAPPDLLILENATWKHAILLLSVAPQIHFLVPKKEKRTFPWFQDLFYSLHLIPATNDISRLIELGAPYRKKGGIPCIFAPNGTSPAAPERKSFWQDLFGKENPKVQRLSLRREPDGHTRIELL